MNKVKVTVLLLLAVLFSGYFVVEQSAAAEKIYLMTGKITAIDLNYTTVVIEVPLAGKMFTVGGPLSENAILKKKGKPANLSDFAAGQIVNVKWRSTPKGHLIESMQSK